MTTTKPNNMKRLIVFLLFMNATRAFGQADIHFSQFYETSILRNPALTGVFADEFKLGAYYRNQWASIINPYQTYLATAETHFALSSRSQDFVSIGLLGFTDKAGSLDQKITSFYPAINYNKSINPARNSFLSVGFTGGYIQYSFDPSKATFNNQYLNGKYDPNNPSLEKLPNPKMNFWDLGAGVNYNTNLGDEYGPTMMFGISAYHFTQPDFSYYSTPTVNLNIRENANAAFSMDVRDDVNLQIQANYAQQGTYNEIMAGGLLRLNVHTAGLGSVLQFSVGAFYRYADAIIPVVKLKYDNLSFGVSYDVNLSTLTPASAMKGGYEMTLFYSGLYPHHNGSALKLVCPRF